MKQKWLCGLVVALLLSCVGTAVYAESGQGADDSATYTVSQETVDSAVASEAGEEESAGQEISDGASSFSAPESTPAPQEASGGEPDSADEPQQTEAAVTAGWREVGGERYYFDANGQVLTGWQMIDGRRYRLDDKTGAQMKGFQLYVGRYWYFYDDDGNLPAPGWQTITKEDGSQSRRYVTAGGSFVTGRQQIDGKWYLFGSSGVLQYGWQLTDGRRCYAGGDGALATGWHVLSGERYCFDAEGMLLTGWQMIDGRRYRLDDKTGAQMKDFQLYAGRYWYFYDADGNLPAPGWQTITKSDGSQSRRYVTAGGSFVTGRQQIDGKWYLFGSSGILQYGWQLTDGRRCYAGGDGALVTGWHVLSGERYYFDAEGRLLTGWQMIDGRRYRLDDKTGAQMKDFQLYAGRYWYFYDADGNLPAPGWQTITKSDGSQSRRYVTAGGSFVTGRQQIDGKWYEFGPSGILQYGWQTNGSDRYYLDEDGSLATGWRVISGERYYFDAEGMLLTGWQMIDGRRYRLDDKTGAQMKGFQLYAGRYWYFYDADGNLPAPGWQTITKEDGSQSRRYVTAGGSFVTGRQQIDGKWYLFGSSGILQYGWQTVDGKTCYADENGALAVGWREMNGNKYWFDENGFAAQGWTTIDQEEYYFDPDTKIGLWHWAVEAAGGRRCVDLKTGQALKGWQKVGGKNYRFDETTGLQLLGFQQDGDGKWYYYDQNGKLPGEGWQTITKEDGSQSRRYVTADGSFAAGVQYIEGSYYVFGSSGIMLYGWQTCNGNTYYLGKDGKAYTGVHIIDGYKCTFTKDGILISKTKGNYLGIDVSAYQGPIDWKAVKQSGVDFAIIRALTWSNSVGYYVIDPYFEYNVRNAKANGIQVGAYLYSYAFSTDEMYTEIDFFHNSAEMKALRKDNIRFDYPVYIDFEWEKILQQTTYDQRTEMLRQGMIRLERYGYYPGFYSNNTWATRYYNAKYLYDLGYDFWYARYPANPDLAAGTKPLLGFEAQMWQYASDGKVNGINHTVDMNVCYVDYASIIHAGGSSGSSVQLTLSVYDVNTSKQVTGSVQDILAQIVMNEVGEWNNDEVCKAQAVAAYSWILYQQQHGNAIPSVGLRAPSASVVRAVSQVAGKALYYNGSVANAAYGSASGKYTNTAKNMWNLDLPYLNTPVESPESSWRGRTNTIRLSTMQTNLSKMVGASLVNSTPHAQWLTNPVYDKNGYLTSIRVCGQQVSAGAFYENCWGLYSPKFTFTYDAGTDSWTFKTDGNGHCVGMSQWGAYTYAKDKGWNYGQILAHYYPQTTLK